MSKIQTWLPSEHPPEGMSEDQHRLYILLSDLYRSIDNLAKNRIQMVEAYSKFRRRDPFDKCLEPMIQDRSILVTGGFPAEISTTAMAGYNLLQNLWITLSCTESLPANVDFEIKDVLQRLIEVWDLIRKEVNERYDWEFKALDLFLPDKAYTD